MSVVAIKIGIHSKMFIQVILILVGSVMIYYDQPIPIFYNIVFQSITILSLFLFGVFVDPSIAILMTCILNIALITCEKKQKNIL